MLTQNLRQQRHLWPLPKDVPNSWALVLNRMGLGLLRKVVVGIEAREE
jgi:hypothetical protein